MKRIFMVGLLALFALASCDSNRIYQKAYDFEESGWHMDSIPAFTFEIEDSQPKNVMLQLRNSIAFKNWNFYLTWYLEDSTGRELKTELLNLELFDSKTGEPQGEGSSIYQHSIDLLKEHSFAYPGKYTVRFAQYSRELQLKHILSVGVRVEEVAD